MRENALHLFSLHKHILCRSTGYPRIGLEDVHDLFIEGELAQDPDDNGKPKKDKAMMLSDDDMARLFSESVASDENES